MTPRRPLIRGRQARREAPAEPAPRGRPEDRPRQSRQDRSRSGSPGIRLGRPCGPGFALRPGLIVRKRTMGADAPKRHGRESPSLPRENDHTDRTSAPPALLPIAVPQCCGAAERQRSGWLSLRSVLRTAASPACAPSRWTSHRLGRFASNRLADCQALMLGMINRGGRTDITIQRRSLDRHCADTRRHRRLS